MPSGTEQRRSLLYLSSVHNLDWIVLFVVVSRSVERLGSSDRTARGLSRMDPSTGAMRRRWRTTHDKRTRTDRMGLTDMDMDSASWLTALGGSGTSRDSALARLHQMLLRVAVHEAHRRRPATRIGGPELDDLAHQAADDAMVSLLAKLDTFRGESRFTTWAYRFVVLEISNKLARHYWRRPSVSLDTEEWDRLPARFGDDPLAQTQHRDLITAVRQAVDDTLTDHQRRFFVAIVVNGVPIDAMVAKSGSSQGAIYKAVFDARRKIRAYLTTNGYLAEEPGITQTTDRKAEVKKA